MDFLIDRLKEGGDQVAFIHNGESHSYSSVVSEIEKYSQFLKDKGIKPFEVVMFVGDYSPEIYSFILALAENKNIFAPLTYDSVVEKEKVAEVAQVKWFIEFNKDLEKMTIQDLGFKADNDYYRQLIEDDEPGLVLFSSGSTGNPKGMVHSFTKVSNKFKDKRSPVKAIVFLMLDHFGGINTLLSITSSLGSVVTVSDRSVKSICQTIQDFQVDLLPTTPSFLNMLVGAQLNKQFNLSSLKKVTYGTEVMPQTTLDRLAKEFPEVKFQQTYGLSEVGVLRSKSREDGSLWVKVGGEGFQTKVKDNILWIKSDYAMLGYLNAPDPFDEEGWFNTQDRVEVDGDYFKILGRITDLINVGGQKVYPSEIENVIIKMDNIEDVSVYSENSPLLGNIIVAKISLKDEEKLSDLKKRVRKKCASELASFKVPAKVVIAKEGLYSARMKKLRKADSASGSSSSTVESGKGV